MNGTPSACPWIVDAVAGSTCPPSTCRRNSEVSTTEKRASFSRRITRIRSMSAISVTASVSVASSSGRIENMRKIGLALSVRIT